MKASQVRLSAPVRSAALILSVAGLLFSPHAAPAAFVPLLAARHNPNESELAPGLVGLTLLLTNGTVMAANPNTSNAWYLLTPDDQGGYGDGTWTTLKPMTNNRLYYSSVVLRDGRVLVAGGEYGTNGMGTTSNLTPPTPPFNMFLALGEIYDPVQNNWSPMAPVPPGWKNLGNLPNGSFALGDSAAELLPNDRVMFGPAFPNATNCAIYNVATDSWTDGPSYQGGLSQNEASWVKLKDGSILTIDKGATTSQRYIPAINQWIADAPVNDAAGNPIILYDAFGAEIGAGVLLASGKAMFFGSTGQTAIYTPTTNSDKTKPGTWSRGAPVPNIQGSWYPGDPSTPPNAADRVDPNANGIGGAPDAPVCVMVNGQVLCAFSRAPHQYVDTTGTTRTVQFPGPTVAYVYDPIANVFTSTGFTLNLPSYKTTMLALPDGSVLYSIGSNELFAYWPDGPGSAPLAAGKPVINNITPNGDGSYHLAGTGLNGISEGAAYGDDAQMATNYPLVRLTNEAGIVRYATTYNWSSTGVMTGSTPVSTEFRLPPEIADGGGGTYSLEVVTNGIASNPVTFAGPVWVDFTSATIIAPPLFEPGTFDDPWNTFLDGRNAVSPGGTLQFKGGSFSLETVTNFNKPMSLISVGGPVTIGHQP